MTTPKITRRGKSGVAKLRAKVEPPIPDEQKNPKNNLYPEMWVKALVKPLWAQLNKDRYNTEESVERKFEEWWNETAKTGRL